MSKTLHLKGTSNAQGRALTVTFLREESDLDAGRVVLQSKEEPPGVVTLVPNDIIDARPIPEAIASVVSDIEAGRVTQSALLDVLARRRPRIKGHDGGPIVRSPSSALGDTIEAVSSLDQSCLVIQGPPGAGKTYTGARIIAALVAQGRRVGIASNSHKAIDNLMLAAARFCQEQGIDAHWVRGKRTSDELEDFGVTITASRGIVDELRDGCVVGTTAWGFARSELAGEFDVLMIDEAGQVALANLVGMSRAAKNLVLMGDQRQLGQPTQASHPAESGLSVLDYLLGDTAAVSTDHGVFLGTTYRMHPSVNALVSRYVYSGQLETAPATQFRTLLPARDPGLLDVEAGVVFLPVPHVNNQQASEEEVAAIVELVNELQTRELRCEDGEVRRVTLEDMLFVAPYNAQVELLTRALGEGARVGSVDRFQGQEAPIVILSLCSSDATGSPRGMGFLFDRNRLNVAVSRAQTLCVLVGHPTLAITPVSTLADLKRVNFVAALMASGSP